MKKNPERKIRIFKLKPGKVESSRFKVEKEARGAALFSPLHLHPSGLLGGLKSDDSCIFFLFPKKAA
ncbi:hypothetical protein LJC47_08385 [Desulfosarcina sp. OttesenSCG-928-B08]|nr:hypothetical protein [Desulfosarcina sp. OttesenSCG-928-B08]